MHNGPPIEVTAEEFTNDVLARHAVTGPRYRTAMLVSGLLFLLGVAAFAVRAASDGFHDRLPWGYFAATTVFLLSTAGSAPVTVAALRLTKNHWRRPLTRFGEIYAVVGLLVLLMVIPLLILLPPAAGRRTMWFQDTEMATLGASSSITIPGAPHAWAALAVITLVLTSLTLLWMSSRPDMALLRDRRDKRPRSLGQGTAGGWRGTLKQWRALKGGMEFLSTFSFVALVGVFTLFTIEFAMALVPGWRDSIFPAFQVIGGLQGGLATVVLTLWVARKYGKMERYVHMEHFWSASKVLLGLTLLWFYFWWASFLLHWYGRMPQEQNELKLLMFGPYRVLFFLAWILCFLLPFSLLLWNSVRKSTWGAPLAASFILVGALLDKIRLYVAAYSVPTDAITAHTLEAIPPTHYPDILDLTMMVGAISGALFLTLLAGRLVPIFSVWEIGEGIRLRVVRPFLKSHVTVMGKPD